MKIRNATFAILWLNINELSSGIHIYMYLPQMSILTISLRSTFGLPRHATDKSGQGFFCFYNIVDCNV